MRHISPDTHRSSESHVLPERMSSQLLLVSPVQGCLVPVDISIHSPLGEQEASTGSCDGIESLCTLPPFGRTVRFDPPAPAPLV